MTEQVLCDIFDFIKQVRPEFGDPCLVLLGGSQSLDIGRHKGQDSDYDFLVLFPHIERPESYTFLSTDKTRTYDLILRDPTTFAYDVLQGIEDGKGTLLHIASYGIAIYDPENRAKNLQSIIKEKHVLGPNHINIRDMEGEIRSLQSNLFHTKENDAFTANLLAVCNRIAKLALRFSGHWTSNGKIGGRFLKEKMPHFCISLQSAFRTAVETHSKEALFQVVNLELPNFFYQADVLCRDKSDEKGKDSFDEKVSDLGEATTSSRINLDAMAHYLRSQNPIALSAAVTWAHIKLGNLIKPLSSERFQNKYEEYFFALGRAVSGLADIESAIHIECPNSISMAERINDLFVRHPSLKMAFENALYGDSKSLKSIFETTLSQISHHPLPYLYRPSPTNYRSDPALLIPDSHIL
jgi:hypothetical protein